MPDEPTPTPDEGEAPIRDEDVEEPVESDGEEEEEEAESPADDSPEVDETAELIEAFKALGSDLGPTLRSLKPHVVIRDLRLVEPRLYTRYFKGFRPDKVGRGRLVSILTPEILARENTKVMQLVTLLWNHANQKLYKAMRDLVRTIDPDVEKVKQIEDEQASSFLEALLAKGYKREQIHACVRLNGVRFTKEFIEGQVAPQPAEAEGAPDAPEA